MYDTRAWSPNVCETRVVTKPEMALETTPYTVERNLPRVNHAQFDNDETSMAATILVQIYQPTLESTELADRNRKPPFAFNLSMIICVLQFANCLGFYPGLHRPTSRVIRCHGSPMFSFTRTEGAGPIAFKEMSHMKFIVNIQSLLPYRECASDTE